MINELLNFAGDFTVSFQDEEIHFGGTLRKQGANIILECITACKQYAPYKNMDHIISNIK